MRDTGNDFRRLPTEDQLQRLCHAISANAIATNRKLAMLVVAKVKGEEINLGLDSMAQGSFIDEDIVHMYPDLFPPIQELPYPLSTTSAHQTSVMATGYIDLTFSIGEHEYQHPVVVVPSFGKLFLLGIDFLERHKWGKDPAKHTITLDGHKPVPYTPHPLVFETDAMKAVIIREKRIKPGEKCYMIAYLKGSMERNLDDVSIGEEGFLRQDGNGTAQLKGLIVCDERVKVEKGCKVVVTMKNDGDQPITITPNTTIAVYSKNALCALVQHDDIPSHIPDADFINHVKTMNLTPARVDDILKILFDRRQAFAMHASKEARLEPISGACHRHRRPSSHQVSPSFHDLPGGADP